MSSNYYVGLDVGGTTMKAGVVDDAGLPLSAVSLPTEAQRGQEFGLERMCETIRSAVAAARLGLEQIAAVGVATAVWRPTPAPRGWCGGRTRRSTRTGADRACMRYYARMGR